MGDLVLCTRLGPGQRTSFPAESRFGCVFDAHSSHSQPSRPLEVLARRPSPPLPDRSAETRRAERPGGGGGGGRVWGIRGTWAQVGTGHSRPGQSGRGRGGRPSRPEGLRQRAVAPHPVPAGSQSASATQCPRGPATHEAGVWVCAVEDSRHCFWRACGTKFLAG